MKKHVKSFLLHPVIAGSSVIFIGSIFTNIFQFLFNLSMSRNLSVVDYGVLARLTSFFMLAALPATAVLPTILHFASTYFAKNEYMMVRGLFLKLAKILLLVGFGITAIVLLFQQHISNFFHITNTFLLIVACIVVLVGFLSTINTGLLQAKLAFRSLVLVNFLGAFLKFALGTVFVLVGYAVQGAMFGVLIAGIAAYLFSFYPLRFLLNRSVKAPKIETKELFSYGIPSAICTFGLTSLITTDVLLAGNFFDERTAGLYAGLSLIARVIFFFSAPIGMAMFPLVVQKYTKKENYNDMFVMAIALVGLFSLGITVFYALFPDFVIIFFLKKVEYLAIKPQLLLFAISMTLYSLLSLLTNFFLSIKKMLVTIPIIIGAMLQLVLLFFYHKTFTEIIVVSLCITSLLLVVLLLYYMRLWQTELKKTHQN